MRKLWAAIGFNPTSFDRPVMTKKVVPAKPLVTEKNIEKVSGIKMNNIPEGKTKEEIVEFL